MLTRNCGQIMELLALSLEITASTTATKPRGSKTSLQYSEFPYRRQTGLEVQDRIVTGFV